MTTMRTRTPGEVIGFLAYLVAVGGGLPDRELLSAALGPTSLAPPGGARTRRRPLETETDGVGLQASNGEGRVGTGFRP